MIIEEQGLKFNIRPGTTDEKVVPEVIKKHVYTNKTIQIEPSDVWLDLGGNIGTFAVLVASKGATVTSYEPEPENFNILNENIQLNNYQTQARTVNATVTSKEDEQTILYLCQTAQNKYRHTTKKIRGRTPINVNNIPFRTVLTPNITAIKMDIEGDEIRILDQTNDWQNVKKLVFEYHFDTDRSIANFKNRIAKLKAHFNIIEHAKMPDRETWDFYPSATIVRCKRL